MARGLPATARQALIPFLLTTLAGIVAVIAVGAIALHTLTETDPVEIFRRAKALPFAAALACFVFANVLVGFRFRALLPRREAPAPGGWTLGSLFYAGHAFQLILPGPAGEVAVVAVLHRRYGVPARDGLATAVHTRFVGLACGAAVAAVALPFADWEGPLGKVVVGMGIVMVLGGLTLGIASAQPSWARVIGRGAIGTVDRLDRWGLGRLAGVMRGSVEMFASSLLDIWKAPRRAWLVVVGWSLVMQALHVVGLWLTAHSLGLAPAWPGLFLGQGLGSIAVLVTLMLPGGLGSYEAVFIASMMVGGGLSLVDAGVLVIAVRLIHLLALVGSGMALGAWAGPLWQAEVRAQVERGRVDTEE